jgi:thiol-disulfide isomerase/thioredoxin
MTTLNKLLKITFVIISLFPLISANASNIPDELLNMPIQLLSGKTVTLKEYEGKRPVYLKFWATWCQPCRKQMPHFEHITQQYGDDLVVIAINLGINDDLAAVQQTQKEFNLTMPMAIDIDGDLAKAFKLLGTPYHLLFDKQMNLVHIGHKADSTLDNKIALISRNEAVDLLADGAITETASSIDLSLDDGNSHALYFSSTWCDWYFSDSRPDMSKECVNAQKLVNELSGKFDKFTWQGIISRLWTGEAELKDYVKKYQITHPVSIDENNSLFHQFAINKLPTLVVVKNGKVLLKTSKFSDSEVLNKKLSTF